MDRRLAVTTPQKRKGTAAERQVADWLIANGVPCERISAGATADRGDLWVPVIEYPTIDVKNHRTIKLAEWVDRAVEQADNAGRAAGVVIHKRPGVTDVGRWYVTTNAAMFLQLIGRP